MNWREIQPKGTDCDKDFAKVSRREWFRKTAGGCAGLALGSLMDVSTVRANAAIAQLADLRPRCPS